MSPRPRRGRWGLVSVLRFLFVGSSAAVFRLFAMDVVGWLVCDVVGWLVSEAAASARWTRDGLVGGSDPRLF